MKDHNLDIPTLKPSLVARESQPTQLPWRSIEIGETGEISGQPSIPVFDLIGDVTRYRIATVAGSDAEFIVRACNSHQALIDALQAISQLAHAALESDGKVFLSESDVARIADAAIEKAGRQ